MDRVLLVHGAATSARVWESVASSLAELGATGGPPVEVTAVDRPRTGSLEDELSWLAPRAAGAWVVGMSGGATLALALAAGGVDLAGVIAHEPAIGSLAPDLLRPMAEAFATGGTTAFARALYGPRWSPEPGAPWLRDEVTARELAMFRGFEPAPPSPAAGTVISTVGEHSPPLRLAVARTLEREFGIAWRAIPGAAHFAAVESPRALAGLVHAVVTRRP